MENKNKNYTGIIICIILAIALGAFWLYSSKPKPVDNALPPITEQKPADNPVVAPTTQSGKIDEYLTINNELRDVNFCGKTYKVKQVMIDGVDVMQRVAEIATKNLIPENLKIGPHGKNVNEWRTLAWDVYPAEKGEVAKGICENSANSNSTNGIIEVGDVTKLDSANFNLGEGSLYTIPGLLEFGIAYPMGDIYLIGKFDGSLMGPIGTLK